MGTIHFPFSHCSLAMRYLKKSQRIPIVMLYGKGREKKIFPAVIGGERLPSAVRIVKLRVDGGLGGTQVQQS